MSAVIVWFADLLFPLPYIVIGLLLADREITWKLFLLLVLLFFTGGTLEAVACHGGHP